MTTIIAKNWPQFLRGTAITLLISIIGTVVGTFIGLMIGVYRTAPKAANKFVALIQKLFGWVLNVYIEVFRGTPMIVQSMVIYYGTAKPLVSILTYSSSCLHRFYQHRAT